VEDLIPIKQTIDEIRNEYLFDDDIEFDRFRVIGQESRDDNRYTWRMFNHLHHHPINVPTAGAQALWITHKENGP
jgi:hypothetical protein